MIMNFLLKQENVFMIFSEIKHVISKSRPKYITEEKLQVLTQSIVGRHIEIGMGLESFD